MIGVIMLVGGSPTAAADPFLLTEWTYSIATTGLAEQVAQSGHLTLDPGSSDGLLDLAVTEFELFAPGYKKVTTLDGDGNIVSEVPYTGRFFQGTAANVADSHASILITGDGVYGIVQAPDRKWSLQPVASSGGSYLQNEVLSTETEQEGGESLTSSSIIDVAINAPPPDCPTLGYRYYGLVPYAAVNYVTYASNWADRITSAYSSGRWMWEKETCLRTELFGVTNAGVNFAETNNDGGLGVFKNWVQRTPTPNAYVLFTAEDMGNGVGGLSVPSNMETSGHGAPYNVEAAYVIAAKDWHCCDSYDPDETDHLSQSSDHEATHLAGEEGHPGDHKSACNYNLMANGPPFWCTYHWRTGTTIGKVMQYGYPKCHTH